MGIVYYFLLNGSKFVGFANSSPLYYLVRITQTFGYIPFEDPPLPFEESYWCDEDKTPKYGTSPSICLELEEQDDIIDASMVPHPKDRKTAAQIVRLFEDKIMHSRIFGKNNDQRFSDIYLLSHENRKRFRFP